MATAANPGYGRRWRVPRTGVAALDVRTTIFQFMKYSAVGAMGTSLHYLTLFALASGMGMEPFPASIVGSVIGAATNYVLNYRFTFASTKRHQLAVPRFLAVSVFSIGLNAALMKAALEWLGVHYLVAQLISTAICLFTNFALNKVWTFSEAQVSGSTTATALTPPCSERPESS